MTGAPPLPQELLTATSEAAWGRGMRVLQGFRMGHDDVAHIRALLRIMAPRPGTRWADIGCGFGEVARLMHAERPDLDFVLINNNAAQLSHAPPQFERVLADMHGLPLSPGSVDGCMFLYSLCHAASIFSVLAEAARITRPGGSLFVFDYERLSGDNALLCERLCAWVQAHDVTVEDASAAGWDVIMHDNPDGDDAVFRDAYRNDVEYELIFRHLAPVVWAARRR